MTFLGIGPGELFIILLILLVVVGPERLPGFARQAGKMVVGLRNWIQQSPDAQLFLRARDELEQELQAIRTDLTQEMETVRLEMQNVREEMIQATREATIDVNRSLDDAALAAREATEQANAALQTAPPNIIAPPAAAMASTEATIPLPELPTDAPVASLPVQHTLDPVVSALPEPVAPVAPVPNPWIGAPATPDAPLANGLPIAPVPRTAKPTAPQTASNPSEVALLREQLASVSAEVRELRQLIETLRTDRLSQDVGEPLEMTRAPE